MAADYSTHYNLIMLGAGDSLSEDDYAFTHRNISNIDAKSYLGAEGHHHDGKAVPVSDPNIAPSVALVTGSGSIPGGRTIRYKFTWVDAFGQETGASPERVITTPSPVSPPLAPSISNVTGGTLQPGSYFYVLTAYKDASTLETIPGTRAYITMPLSATLKSVRLHFPSLPPGATGFNIYRRSPGSMRFQWLTSVNMNLATPPTDFVDTGVLVEDCNRTVPQRNTTANQNAVRISIPGATPIVPAGFTWKLYRTYTLNDWDSSLLHWVVEQTSDNSGILETSYTDLGQATSSGKFPAHTELAASPSKILLTDSTEVTGFLPPGRNLVPSSIICAFQGLVQVGSTQWEWVCPYEKGILVSAFAYLGRNYAPSGTPVIVDILKYNLGWNSIFTNTSYRPTIPVGENVGGVVVFNETNVNSLSLVQGNKLSVDVIQRGSGATPTDYDLTICIKILVQDGSQTVSPIL